MSEANNMRQYLKLFEASMDYTGPMHGDSVSYSAEGSKGVITKITAYLTSFASGRYTKLGRNLKRIEFLESRIKKLKEETKAETKELIADLFHAEDIVSTRVVETIGFTFELTKNPKDRETVKYAEVIKKLQDHLTPELISIMEGLIKEHTSSSKVSPSLKAHDKRQEYSEGAETPGGFDIAGEIDQWSNNFDHKLDQLKNMVMGGV